MTCRLTVTLPDGTTEELTVPSQCVELFEGLSGLETFHSFRVSKGDHTSFAMTHLRKLVRNRQITNIAVTTPRDGSYNRIVTFGDMDNPKAFAESIKAGHALVSILLT